MKGIQNWYAKVGKDFRNENQSLFYYDYYKTTGLLLQGGRYGTDSKEGGNASGILGVESEFAESILVTAAVPYGFFGLEATEGKKLHVEPALPSELSYWKMENLMFSNVKYDLTITDNEVRVEAVRGKTDGLTLEIALDYKEGQSVYVNGIKQTGFEKKNGKAIVTVPFGKVTVEVR